MIVTLHHVTFQDCELAHQVAVRLLGIPFSGLLLILVELHGVAKQATSCCQDIGTRFNNLNQSLLRHPLYTYSPTFSRKMRCYVSSSSFPFLQVVTNLRLSLKVQTHGRISSLFLIWAADLLP